MESDLDMTTWKAYFPSMDNDVRRLRAERGLSQADLGSALGVSRQTVNAIEAGRYDPSLPLAFKLARFFGRPIEEMFHVD